jgi:hypothetical protein
MLLDGECARLARAACRFGDEPALLVTEENPLDGAPAHRVHQRNCLDGEPAAPAR